MLAGSVNAFREAILRVILRGPGGVEREIEAVVDTGYDGALTLPPSLIGDLGLPFRRRASALLGDGTRSVHDVHEGVVLWSGQARRIAVDAAETDALLGMALLEGHELTIQVIAGGLVSVRELLTS